jgi:hypothetical protein
MNNKTIFRIVLLLVFIILLIVSLHFKSVLDKIEQLMVSAGKYRNVDYGDLNRDDINPYNNIVNTIKPYFKQIFGKNSPPYVTPIENDPIGKYLTYPPRTISIIACNIILLLSLICIIVISIILLKQNKKMLLVATNIFTILLLLFLPVLSISGHKVDLIMRMRTMVMYEWDWIEKAGRESWNNQYNHYAKRVYGDNFNLDTDMYSEDTLKKNSTWWNVLIASSFICGIGTILLSIKIITKSKK